MADWEEDNTKPFPQELPDAYKRARELDDEHVYLNPFRLSFVVDPNIARHVGVTMERVPVGSIDLSVNTSDQLIHGH